MRIKRINVLSRLLKKLTIIILTLASVTVIYLMILQHGISIRNITSESNAINDNNTETEATLFGENKEMMVSVWIDLPNALVKNKDKEKIIVISLE